MRRYALFVGLLVLFAAARFAILLTSQTHVHSDEAIIGLMGKHILEGRYFPFYMYGQPYNAGAAWEAYLAAVAFAIFGVGVVPLKGCIVVLSLVTLFLFYQMCLALYEQRTALLAVIVFAIVPSLLKWHFQVRGYSWYFLSIPVLTLLFLSIESTPNRAVAAVSLIWNCFGFKHLEPGTGRHICHGPLALLSAAPRFIAEKCTGRGWRIPSWLRTSYRI